MQAEIEATASVTRLISIFLIILGWVIITVQNNKRETRKETRAAINDIKAMIENLMAESIDYHTQDRDKRLEAKISAACTELSTMIEYAAKPIGSEHSLKILEFSNVIMQENFMSKHTALSNDDFLIIRIHHAGKQLRLDLEESYSLKFHGGNWLTRMFY